jgi:hypothetical protein
MPGGDLDGVLNSCGFLGEAELRFYLAEILVGLRCA